jgi:hypothetical protein
VSFTDVDKNSWYYSYVIDAYMLGLMRGVSSTKFNPEGNLTVAELLTTCLNLLKEPVDAEETQVYWYDPYVRVALDLGLVKQGDSFYKRLNDPVTRNEMATIIVRAVAVIDEDAIVTDYSWSGNALADGDEIPQRYRESVFKAYASGILKGNGDNRFNGESYLTRAEAATVMVRIEKRDFVRPTIR